VPQFSLIERSGKTTTLADLRGTIWIADFIYTTCQDTCPLQTAEMAQLQEQWKDKPGLKLVSFSVDPEKDTTEGSSATRIAKADAALALSHRSEGRNRSPRARGIQVERGCFIKRR
jgi:cytochrome oxidase Cu insertion factor (SCO1/SenC/PrrC family)